MFRPLISVMTLQLVAVVALNTPAQAADTSRSASQQVALNDRSNYDQDAEHRLLELANSDRARAGLPQLRMDDGLVRAARTHAAEMASAKQLSHQFSDEPALNQRIAAVSTIHLDRTGENVAVATNAEEAHAALMSSLPHRENLLSRNFNVAGIGVFRSGNSIYVAQDFGSSSPSYSVKQASTLVTKSVEQLRAQARMPRLQLVDSGNAQSSACAMAQSDSLKSAASAAGSYTLRYTSMNPEILPANISKVIAQRSLHAYSAGTCYAQTQKYPNGAYWVVLVFYQY